MLSDWRGSCRSSRRDETIAFRCAHELASTTGRSIFTRTLWAYFGRLVGESEQSGVSFPDMVKIGCAYGLPSVRIEAPTFEGQLDDFLAAPGPGLCEVMLDPAQQFEPKLSSRQLADGKMVSSPLEDMYPFLPREELRANMLIPLVEE